MSEAGAGERERGRKPDLRSPVEDAASCCLATGDTGTAVVAMGGLAPKNPANPGGREGGLGVGAFGLGVKTSRPVAAVDGGVFLGLLQ